MWFLFSFFEDLSLDLQHSDFILVWNWFGVWILFIPEIASLFQCLGFISDKTSGDLPFLFLYHLNCFGEEWDFLCQWSYPSMINFPLLGHRFYYLWNCFIKIVTLAMRDYDLSIFLFIWHCSHSLPEISKDKNSAIDSIPQTHWPSDRSQGTHRY